MFDVTPCACDNMSMELPRVIASTKDYQLTAQLRDGGEWRISFKFRGAEAVSYIHPCEYESAKRTAVILARRHVARMFEGIL